MTGTRDVLEGRDKNFPDYLPGFFSDKIQMDSFDVETSTAS